MYLDQLVASFLSVHILPSQAHLLRGTRLDLSDSSAVVHESTQLPTLISVLRTRSTSVVLCSTSLDLFSVVHH